RTHAKKQNRTSHTTHITRKRIPARRPTQQNSARNETPTRRGGYPNAAAPAKPATQSPETQHKPRNSPHTPPKTTTHAPESAAPAPESAAPAPEPAAPAPEPATRGPGNATRAWVHPIVDLDNPVCQLDADADRTETGVVLADQRKEARMGQGSVLRGRFGRTRRRAGDGERRCVEGKVVTITGGARGIGART